MKKSIKNFIFSLPGPQSYCKCDKLCSMHTVDHVIPKAYIKKTYKKVDRYANDLHNLYPCCKKLNFEKGSNIFGKDFLFGIDQSYHTGPLSRACLYMYDVYELPVEGKIVALWRELDKVHKPQEFEIIRNDMIYERIGVDNHHLIKHLD